MQYTPYPQGSEWRKWDLHVHTPASFHWQGGNLLRNMNEDDRISSFRDLYDTLISSDVAVFAFTDYWTFDGYLGFKSFLQCEDLSPPCTVFPGIELRVEAPVNYRLNMQVILSDTRTVQELHDFKSCLHVRSINRQISDEAIIEFARTLDESKANKHGFESPSKLSEDDLLRLGVQTIEVTQGSLQQAMKAVPPGSALIVMPYDTSDGLEALEWESQPHADNYFMQSAHAFESRSQATMDLFHGVKNEDNESFIENFQTTLNNVKKPVICGSDAHRYSDYGRFPSDQITWIKADPSWEGFKQILFEPRERVQIQQFKPQQKTPYLVLEKIRFLDKTGAKLFSSEWISLGENLNVVIGGKSSGKSLLLYHIAKSTTPDIIRQREAEYDLATYEFGYPGAVDFEVVWKDGREDRYSDDPEKIQREIEFIPQLYVNALAEKDGKNTLFLLIERIMEQNSDYKEFIKSIRKRISDLEASIEQETANLLNLREDLALLYSERRNIGESDAITKEAQRLQTEVDSLREASDFTEAEHRDYEKLTSKYQSLQVRRKKYQSLENAVSDLSQTIHDQDSKTRNALNAYQSSVYLDDFIQRIVDACIRNSLLILHKAYKGLSQSLESLRKNAVKKSESIDEIIPITQEQIRPYAEKIRDQNRLNRLGELLAQQTEKLAAYTEMTRRIDGVKENGLLSRKTLLDNYTAILHCYKEVYAELQREEYAKIDEEITLEVEISFDNGAFDQSFGELFDRRTRFSNAFSGLFDESDQFKFEVESHIDSVTSIFDELSKQSGTKFTFRKHVTPSRAIQMLFKNYFTIEYNLRYKDDDILQMSPGKRGLVLLQLILHISNATHPILIDQPEDNLDNRTISSELKRFIRLKKNIRQIIMVTHDANLVVLTDAENVIVSNQAGQQIDRENAEFKFEYVTGSLEHTFRYDPDSKHQGILQSVGIREHVCEILEGGEDAFREREQRYGFSWR